MTWPTFWQFCQFLTILTPVDNFWQFYNMWHFLAMLKLYNFDSLDNWNYVDNYLFTILTILETCDIWDTDYNSDNWEPEFMTIIVTCQLWVIVDSIRNSCDVFYFSYRRVVGQTCSWGSKSLWELQHLAENHQCLAFYSSTVSPYIVLSNTWLLIQTGGPKP